MTALFALLDRFVPVALDPVWPCSNRSVVLGQLESPMPDQTLAYLIAVAMLAAAIWLCEPRTAWLGPRSSPLPRPR